MVESSSNEAENGGQGLISNAIDNTLLDILKTYYRMSRALSEESRLAEDQMLIKTMCQYMKDPRPKVSLYVCKILLELSKEIQSAARLSKNTELCNHIASACESTEMPPQVIRGLLIVQSRMANVPKEPTHKSNDRRSFFHKAMKQFIFQFENLSEVQKRMIEKSCIGISGVISVCFQHLADNYSKCIVRCRDSLDAKVIANGIMNDVGLDTVQMFAKLDDGSQEIFTYYAEVENVERVDRSEMPQYLEDNVECFDPSQCIVTKEQLDKQHNSSSWFSLSTLKFW